MTTGTFTTLACPQCGSTEELATREALLGSARLNRVTRDAFGQVDYEHEGYTEVHWDSSETTGVECRACFWQGGEDDLAVAA